MKCEKCGTPVISGEEYCRICGNKYNLENEVEVLGDTTAPEVLNIEEIEKEILTVDGPITDSPVEIETEEFNKEEILKSDEVKKEKPHKKSKMSQAEDVAEMIIKKESFNIFTVVLLILFIASVVLNVLLFVNRDEVEGVTASDDEYKIVYIDGSEYKIKDDWIYENNESLIFSDKTNNWGVSLVKAEMNFDNVKTNKVDLYESIKKSGFEITSDYDKKVNKKDNLLFKGKFGEYNTYIIITKVDDENVVITKVLFKSEVDDILLDNVLEVVTSAKEAPESIVSDNFTFEDITEVIKKLDVAKEAEAEKE